MDFSKNKSEAGKIHLLKINILNSMANDIGFFLQNQGVENFMDYLDMNCGAVPEGSYEEIIDPEAEEQFLGLYSGISMFRFAFAVSQALKINEAFFPAIKNYCLEKGRSLKPESIPSVQAAFKVLDSCILDEMTAVTQKKITEQSEKFIKWEILKDCNEDFWNKAECNLSIYKELKNQFIQGLLEDSGIAYSEDGNRSYILKMQ